jgi:hypothetical protein
MSRVLMAILLAGWGVQSAPAQGVLQFSWKPGQVLTYRVEQQTEAVDVSSDGKVETKTKLSLTKRWQVQSVDVSGVATMQHSLLALRMETTTPTGEILLFDSAAPDKGDPKLREQLSRYVGVPLSTLRVDPLGRVVEVKECNFGPASRFEAEPPFALVLPGTGVKPGTSWERPYKITQEPPLGTGEKYDAVQRYSCARVEGSAVVVSLSTEMKTQPDSIADRVPLLQLQPEGVVVFDAGTGRLHSAQLRVKKELKGHLGAGSTYTFTSTYNQQLVTDR